MLVALHAELDTGIAMNWIDVNEKLPETGIDSVYGSEWVLVSYVFDGKQYVGEARFIKVKQSYWENVFGDKMINNQVTHWMPLPEPPMIGV
mgnify:FL=1